MLPAKDVSLWRAHQVLKTMHLDTKSPNLRTTLDRFFKGRRAGAIAVADKIPRVVEYQLTRENWIEISIKTRNPVSRPVFPLCCSLALEFAPFCLPPCQRLQRVGGKERTMSLALRAPGLHVLEGGFCSLLPSEGLRDRQFETIRVMQSHHSHSPGHVGRL